MLTDDPKKIEFATDYWALNDSGKWKYQPLEVAAKHSVAPSRLHYEASKCCVATDVDICCQNPSCARPFPLKSRPQYSADRKALHSLRGARVHAPNLCNQCKEHLLILRKEESARQSRIKDEKISQWLNVAATNAPTAIHYEAASVLDAFLMSGILLFSGENLADGKLRSWSSHQTRFFGMREENQKMYAHLYQQGWIFPDANSPLDAFSVDASGNVIFDALDVNWTVAVDTGGLPISALLHLLKEKLQSAAREDLAAPWYWVCMAELHENFMAIHYRQQLKKMGWTPTVEAALRNLLVETSLGQALFLVYTNLMHVSGRLNNREIPTYITYNSIPGSFHKSLIRHRANGWPLKSRDRWESKEAFFTTYLFDAVLGCGPEAFHKVTGGYLEGITECA